MLLFMNVRKNLGTLPSCQGYQACKEIHIHTQHRLLNLKTGSVSNYHKRIGLKWGASSLTTRPTSQQVTGDRQQRQCFFRLTSKADQPTGIVASTDFRPGNAYLYTLHLRLHCFNSFSCLLGTSNVIVCLRRRVL